MCWQDAGKYAAASSGGGGDGGGVGCDVRLRLRWEVLVSLAEGDGTSDRGAWWLQSVRLRRQAMRTSVSSMSTPTTRRAPHNCAGQCGGSTSACSCGREIQRRAYLAGHPTLVTTDIEHACICKEFRR
jgi:hypothetical protein